MINLSSISRHLRAVVLVALGLLIMLPGDLSGGLTDQITQTASAASKKKSKKKRRSKKATRSKSKRKSSRKKRRSKKRRTPKPVVTTLYTSPDGREFIHRGKRGIIVSRDTAGVVRGMAPLTTMAYGGADYAAAINRYAGALAGDSVRLYMLIAPSQGEYYMPDRIGGRGSEARAIRNTAAMLDKAVTPILVDSIMRAHTDEEIYSRTDHHWSPRGGRYAAAELARAAGLPFLPDSHYRADTVHNYVGTMFMFSGDSAVSKAPEEFVWFEPIDTNYASTFVDYTINGGRAVSESAPHPAPFFRPYPDGSRAAYCTFMGGDYHAVKVTGLKGDPSRRLLIVKDSFGNALPSNLFGTFGEIHVLDFRYFPHNLVRYVRENGITDMVFVNCISIAFAPNTARRLNTMLTTADTDFGATGDTPPAPAGQTEETQSENPADNSGENAEYADGPDEETEPEGEEPDGEEGKNK